MSHIQAVLMPNIVPGTITTNFDWKLRTSIQDVWPNTRVVSTVYSYIGIILKQAENDPVINLTENAHLKILKKLISIALQPAQYINDTFNMLYQSVLATEYRQNFIGLFDWFKNIFIIDLTPRNLSFYNQKNLMTNMPMMSARKLSNLIDPENDGNCTFWNFYCK